MVITLQLRQREPTGLHIEINTATSKIVTWFTDPFEGLAESSLNEDPRKTIKWYLKECINEPFETAKADLIAETLIAYGRALATQIAQTGSLPNHGDVELEIVTKSHNTNSATKTSLSSPHLHELYWEVLEDVKVWPREYSLQNVRATRLVQGTQVDSTINDHAKHETFRILLVVYRPDRTGKMGCQIVPRCLVAITDHISRANIVKNVSLIILRLPTWMELQLHLQNQSYEVVHFDMHGRIKNDSKPSATYAHPYS